jgi:hypothetical protein
MFERLLAPLLETLRPHFDLSKTRLETLAVLLFGLANCRTVNLSHLASQFPGDARHASNYRRLQRFFQHIRLDGDIGAQLIVGMLKLGRPKLLALDRTNWKLGSRDVNVLVLAIVTRRFPVPLMWTLLPHAGNSDTAQRIALLERYLSLFGASSIRALLADREFVGAEWLKFLCENNVPFAIRLRENMQIQLADGRMFQFRSGLRNRRRGTWEGWLNGMDATPANQLRVAAKRIKGSELLIVATNIEESVSGLNLYRKRWGIECLFADAKTRGLNIEDTHITDPDKLATLLVVVALAVTWAYRCGTRAMGRTAIPRKAHGRYEKSWFRTGFDTLRNWIIHQPGQALDAWVSTCPRRPYQPARSG